MSDMILVRNDEGNEHSIKVIEEALCVKCIFILIVMQLQKRGGKGGKKEEPKKKKGVITVQRAPRGKKSVTVVKGLSGFGEYGREGHRIIWLGKKWSLLSHRSERRESMRIEESHFLRCHHYYCGNRYE